MKNISVDAESLAKNIRYIEEKNEELKNNVVKLSDLINRFSCSDDNPSDCTLINDLNIIIDRLNEYINNTDRIKEESLFALKRYDMLETQAEKIVHAVHG